jgi:hypothetical protein
MMLRPFLFMAGNDHRVIIGSLKTTGRSRKELRRGTTEARPSF